MEKTGVFQKQMFLHDIIAKFVLKQPKRANQNGLFETQKRLLQAQ